MLETFNKKMLAPRSCQEPEAAAAAEPVAEPSTEGAVSAPMDPTSGDAFAGLASLAAGAQLPKRLGNCLYDASGEMSNVQLLSFVS